MPNATVDGRLSWQVRAAGQLVLLLPVVLWSACGGGEAGRDPTPQTFGVTDGAAFGEAAHAGFADCMAERGFLVLATPDGGSEFTPPEGQEAEAESAEAECLERVSEMTPVDFSPEDLRLLYAAQQDVARCLRSEGYSVPEAPTIDAYLESGGSNWLPYSAVEYSDAEQWREVNETCPQP